MQPTLTQTAPDKPHHIAIIGAGIAGLTAALLCAKQGAKVTIFEKVSNLEDIGAGIQISPNASKILSRIGITDQLRPLWIEPERVVLTDAQSLRQITHVPIKSLAQKRWKAPYAVLKRSQLQQALLAAIHQNDNCTLLLDQALDFSSKTTLMRDLAHQMGQPADLIIGADGVHSKCRTLIYGADKVKNKAKNKSRSTAHKTPYTAWRLSLDHDLLASQAAHLAHQNQVSVLMANRAHTVIYPKNRHLHADGTTTNEHNIVFVTATGYDLDWPDIIASTDLHSAIKICLRGSEFSGRWPIYDVPMTPWHDGDNLVLIGDAAHAMKPFMAQGSAMAIEDAGVLSHLIGNMNQSLNFIFEAFEKQRKTRIDMVRKRTDFNRLAYHARGPVQFGRNLVLSLKSPESLGRDLDWLYGFEIEGS